MAQPLRNAISESQHKLTVRLSHKVHRSYLCTDDALMEQLRALLAMRKAYSCSR
jgi:hypothetical protein